MGKVLSLIMLFVIVACSGSPKMPTDFYFKLTDDVNSYDSGNGKYTRKAINANFGDTTITVELRHDEVEKIYQTMVENYAFNLPDAFKCVPNSEYEHPSSTIILQFQVGRRYKKVAYDSGCKNPVDRWSANNFRAIDSTITSILEANQLINKLPKTKLVSL